MFALQFHILLYNMITVVYMYVLQMKKDMHGRQMDIARICPKLSSHRFVRCGRQVMVADQWLKHWTTAWKVMGSNPSTVTSGPLSKALNCSVARYKLPLASAKCHKWKVNKQTPVFMYVVISTFELWFPIWCCLFIHRNQALVGPKHLVQDHLTVV